MFIREAAAQFRAWAHSSEHKPLILRGARQVGKTSLVQAMAPEFDTYIELNLEWPVQARLFKQNLSLEDLLQAIYLSKQCQPRGKVLLFIDEIQHSPEAVQYLRYFYEQRPDLYVVAAGSLLEVMLEHQQLSFPVGRVEMMVLYPCSFREFLTALDDRQSLALLNQIPVPSFALPHLFKRFHDYALVGGMPEIIGHYAKHQDVTALNGRYQSLLLTYLDDVSKYARNTSLSQVMRHCLEASVYEVGQRITFAGFGHSHYRSREVGEALKTLERALLITLLYPTTSVEIPIRADFKKKPRLQWLDTGLVNYFAGLQTHFFEHEDLHGFYRGLVAEHIVGQELLQASRNHLHKLCFWVRENPQANAEVDFVWPHRQWVIPIEVKAGKSGTLRSLHQFVERSPHPYAVRLYHGSVEWVQTKTPQGKAYQLLSLPYFLAAQLPDYLNHFGMV